MTKSLNQTYAAAIRDDVSGGCYRGVLREAITLNVIRGCVHQHRSVDTALKCARRLRRMFPTVEQGKVSELKGNNAK